MAAVVIINDGHSLGVKVCHINQPTKSKLSLYRPLLSLFKQLHVHKQQDRIL